MRHFSLALLIAALSCAACGGTTDDSGSPVAQSMTLEEFQTAVAGPLCDRVALCCSGTAFDQTACLSKSHFLMTDRLDLDESREFLGQNAAACVKAIESAPMSCQGLWEDPGIDKACARSLLSNGTRKAGEACVDGNNCASSESTRGDCRDKVCVDIKLVSQAGQPCNGDTIVCDERGASLYCDSATMACKAMQKVGDPCESTCVGYNLACDPGTKACVAWEKGLGDACDTSGASESGGCVAGYECKNGKCEVDDMLCSVLGS